MQNTESFLELDMQELETMDAPGFLTGMVASATVTSAIGASAAAAYT
ncbi:hypothetical protein [Nocardioides lijunqiniae]|nr:hypothetical protein [Nocardioides lijunqiniae]